MTAPHRKIDFDAAVALRPGRADPMIVLTLWCLRKAFFPLFWLGMILATTSGRIRDVDAAGGITGYVTSFTSVGELLSALLSPLAVVILAFAMRFAVAGLAFVAAYPLTTAFEPHDYAHGRRRRSHVRMWTDRWNLTRAFRALRWTWAVRSLAAERLDTPGARMEMCTPILRWLGVAALIGYVVIAANVVGPSP